MLKLWIQSRVDLHKKIYPRSYSKTPSATASTTSLPSNFKGFGFFKA